MMIFVLIAIAASLPIPRLAGQVRPRRTRGKSLGMCETFTDFRICALENSQKVSFFVFADQKLTVEVKKTPETGAETAESGEAAVAVTLTSVKNQYDVKSQKQFMKKDQSADYAHGYTVSTDKNVDEVHLSISTPDADPNGINLSINPQIVIFTPKAKRTSSSKKVFDLQDDVYADLPGLPNEVPPTALPPIPNGSTN
jgi:hypothetical protein